MGYNNLPHDVELTYYLSMTLGVAPPPQGSTAKTNYTLQKDIVEKIDNIAGHYGVPKSWVVNRLLQVALDGLDRDADKIRVESAANAVLHDKNVKGRSEG